VKTKIKPIYNPNGVSQYPNTLQYGQLHNFDSAKAITKQFENQSNLGFMSKWLDELMQQVNPFPESYKEMHQIKYIIRWYLINNLQDRAERRNVTPGKTSFEVILLLPTLHLRKISWRNLSRDKTPHISDLSLCLHKLPYWHLMYIYRYSHMTVCPSRPPFTPASILMR
jgi:hypothetical protein